MDESGRISMAPENEIRNVMRQVSAWLCRRFHGMPEDLIHDAVVDALVDSLYADRMNHGLHRRYLARAAYCNVVNAWRGYIARRTRERDWWAQSMPASAGIGAPYGTDETAREACEKIEALLPDRDMRKLWQLQLMGKRRTEDAAKALGLTHLPLATRKRIITRHKDRLFKYLRRNARVREIICDWAESVHT